MLYGCASETNGGENKQDKLDASSQLLRAKSQNDCCLVYGAASVGKTFMLKRDPYAEIIDCTEMHNSIN